MKAIVETIEHHDWLIKEWKIKFLLSESQLREVRMLSRVSNWYEDPVIADTWNEKLSTCFKSIQTFYKTFGVLPQIGDRLFDSDLGMMIENRSIDGDMMTITFTVSD